jgi:versiconal hemiacetal acetate reductase
MRNQYLGHSPLKLLSTFLFPLAPSEFKETEQFVQADVYSNRRSEEIIGKALKKYEIPPSQVVILTKVYYALDPVGQSPIVQLGFKDKQGFVNRVGLYRKHIFDAVEGSCKRLGTYIDVLQSHRLDRETSPEEIVGRVEEIAKKRGVGTATIALA